MSRQSAKKCADKLPSHQDQQEDKEMAELLQVLLARKPYYEKIHKNILGMGLPVAKPFIQNQNAIANLKKNPKNVVLLQRFLSIHLEGQPKIYHHVKLAKNCQNFLKPYSNLDIEELIGLVHETVKITDFPYQLKRVENSKKKLVEKKLREFSYSYFLDQINVSGLEVDKQYETFNSTEIDGVYEVKDINILRDYGDLSYFEKTRVLRKKVLEVIQAIENILDSFKTKNIDLIQDSFLAYIELKRNLELPFTQKIVKEELLEEEERYSTKSEISVNSSHSIKIDGEKPSRAQSAQKRQPQNDTKSTQQIQQKGVLSDLPLKSLKKKNIKKKKNIQKVETDQQIWNELTQNQFEQIFYQSQDVSLKTLTQRIPDQLLKVSSKRKKLLSQGKHCVAYEIFDSYRYYEAKILDIKPVNPRNPFKKYQFIAYDIDSEEEICEEVAEDVESEIRSAEGSPSSSMQEFIEIDYKSCNQIFHGEATSSILNSENIDYFIPFKAIIISNNVPLHKSTQKKKVPNAKSNNLSQQNIQTQQEQAKQPILDTQQLLVIAQSDFQIVPNDNDVEQQQ